MSSRKYDAHQTKRNSSSFTIEALISKKKTSSNCDCENVASTTRKSDSVGQLRADSCVTSEAGDDSRRSMSVEMGADKLNRPYSPPDGAAVVSPKTFSRPDATQHGGDDIADVEEGSEKEKGHSGCVTPPGCRLPQTHTSHVQSHQYKRQLQQFHQLLSRPEAIHPLLRPNMLSGPAAATSSQRLPSSACTNPLLRRPIGLAGGTSAPTGPPNPLFCYPPAHPGISPQRPPETREEELVPFYTWLLSRHGAFFNHRLHPAVYGSDPTGGLLLPFRKPKRIRTAFSPSQLLQLEEAFGKNHYVVGQERKDLAASLNLTETQVKVWFQNRRTKHKRIQSDDIDDSDTRALGGSAAAAEDGDISSDDEQLVDVDCSPASSPSHSSPSDLPDFQPHPPLPDSPTEHRWLPYTTPTPGHSLDPSAHSRLNDTRRLPVMHRDFRSAMFAHPHSDYHHSNASFGSSTVTMTSSFTST